MIAALLARPALRVGLIAASGVALMAVGAAAWDRTPWFGPHVKITGLRAELKTVNANLATVTGQREGWRTRAGNCENARRTTRDDAAKKIVVTETASTKADGEAFEAGYRAGRAVGRQSCEVNHAKDPAPAAGGVTAPGGLPDESSTDAWNAGRYQPDAALPR